MKFALFPYYNEGKAAWPPSPTSPPSGPRNRAPNVTEVPMVKLRPMLRVPRRLPRVRTLLGLGAALGALLACTLATSTPSPTPTLT
ncbi:hypothetical protein SE15_07180, partial [Thermanaerothrix daxensis]